MNLYYSLIYSFYIPHIVLNEIKIIMLPRSSISAHIHPAPHKVHIPDSFVSIIYKTPLHSAQVSPAKHGLQNQTVFIRGY